MITAKVFLLIMMVSSPMMYFHRLTDSTGYHRLQQLDGRNIVNHQREKNHLLVRQDEQKVMPADQKRNRIHAHLQVMWGRGLLVEGRIELRKTKIKTNILHLMIQKEQGGKIIQGIEEKTEDPH